MASTGKLIEIPEWFTEFQWRISNLKLSVKKRCISPEFPFAGASWCLVMCPYSTNDEYSSLYLTRLSKGSCTPPIEIEFHLGVKIWYKETNVGRYRCVFANNDPKGDDKLFSIRFLMEHRSEFVSNDALTVFCKMKHLKSSDDISGTEATKCSHCKEILNPEDLLLHEKKCINKPIKCPECSSVVSLKNWYEHECENREETGPNTPSTGMLPQKNKIIQDLKQLFLNQEDTDVVFKVKGQEFAAHRIILKARSPVLASAFRNDMKEKATGVVDIEDCNPLTFSDFLCFLYCDEVDNLSQENVFGLFTAADKYDVQDLKTMCLKFMKEHLCVDIFCETITLAFRHSETELINLTTAFFVKHAEKIIVTPKWMSFAAENPTQSNELFIKYVESVKCSNS